MSVTTTPHRYVHEQQGFTGAFFSPDPAPSARRPGVIVFHGGAGLDDHARDRARRIADLGYMAFAADLYGDDVRGDRPRTLETIGRFQREPEFLRQRARAGLAQLASHPQVDGRVAAVGYCLGGMTAIELARSGGAMHGFTHDPAGPTHPGVAYHALADARSSGALCALLAEAFS